MGDFFKLIADRLIDLGHAVAVHVAPQAGDAVEVAIAVAVEKMHPISAGDHKRLRIEPQFHRRERMPDVLLVELAKLLRRHVVD